MHSTFWIGILSCHIYCTTVTVTYFFAQEHLMFFLFLLSTTTVTHSRVAPAKFKMP